MAMERFVSGEEVMQKKKKPKPKHNTVLGCIQGWLFIKQENDNKSNDGREI